MGLMAEMQITSCSFAANSVSLQGELGTITSSKHPVLGPILHFTPRDVGNPPRDMFAVNSKTAGVIVEERWLAPTWDVCMVARKFLNSNKRRKIRRLGERWLRDQNGISFFELSVPGDRDFQRRDKPKKEKAEMDATTIVAAPHQSKQKGLDAAPEGKSLQAGDDGKFDINPDDRCTSMTPKGQVIRSDQIRRCL